MSQSHLAADTSHAAVADDHGHHSPHLAHHYDTLEQQFDAGKLGMWTFLSTEILMFGGLFCAYAVYRANHPEVFQYAHHHLDRNLGAINTVILIASSFTMAWAVRAAQLGRRTLLVALLGLTLLGGFGFMAIKTIEYSSKWEHGLWVGVSNMFHPKSEREIVLHKDDHAAEDGAAHAGDAAVHADAVPAREGHDDAAAGKPAAASADDAHGGVAQAANADGATPAVDGTQAGVNQETKPSGPEKSLISVPPNGPRGLSPVYVSAAVAPVGSPGVGHGHLEYEDLAPEEKERVHLFFQIYFLMTGLHGLHVLVGMGLIGFLMIKSATGAYGPEYFTPVDLGGLYWHLVDLIWIFLFPLLYLIH